MRDPRTNPQPGDILGQRESARKVMITRVDSGMVYFTPLAEDYSYHLWRGYKMPPEDYLQAAADADVLRVGWTA